MTTHRHTANALADELETLLTGIGLPISTTGDRSMAQGVVITQRGPRDTSIEWFVSLTARQAAAKEHAQGISDGRAARLHSGARQQMHWAIGTFLQAFGYSVESSPEGMVYISGQAGASTGSQAAEDLTALLRADGDDLAAARQGRKPGNDDGDDDGDGAAGVLAKV